MRATVEPFLKLILFVRAVVGLPWRRREAGHRGLPCVHPASPHTVSPLSAYLTRWYIFYQNKPESTNQNHPKSISLGLSFGIVQAMGLDKSKMTCIHHCNVIQSILLPPKMLCAPAVHLSLEAIWGQMEDFPRVHIAKSIKEYIRIKMKWKPQKLVEGIMF